MTLFHKYVKKPIVVEAQQFFKDAYLSDPSPWLSIITLKTGSGYPFVQTLEGDMYVSDGDYIIRGIDGEYYPCKPTIFEKTYERVNV